MKKPSFSREKSKFQMVNIEDLWIGDTLRLIKSGRIGKFDGLSSDGKIKIKVADKTIKTTPKNVILYEEDKMDSILDFPAPKTTLEKSKKLKTSIDLHLEKLNPSMLNARPERIVDFQVESAKQFIEESISNGTYKITIIHGIGEGVLKAEIKHLLSLYDEIQFAIEINQGGATEAWLKT